MNHTHTEVMVTRKCVECGISRKITIYSLRKGSQKYCRRCALKLFAAGRNRQPRFA
jgi:uncharacterized paraquat-inducible protein A